MYYEHEASTVRNYNPRKWFKCIFACCGAEKQSSFPVVPTKLELESAENKLLDAFTAPWTDQESTASTVRKLADGFEDRSPPLPNIGQVKSILKHLNSRKAAGADGVLA